MASTYSSFLQSPTTSLLAADASLVYITTTTEIKEPAAILKHFQSQAKQLEKKDEKILNAVEGADGLALETETTLLFKAGGGAYLPGIDENHLDERIVTFPLMHIVRFDEEKKIKQIRLYWDQGTLLKQVEVIGKTGRNWPIRDGRAQIEAMNKSLNAGGRTTDLNGSAAAPRGPHDVIISQHKKRDSVSATRDPHASLALFTPRDPNEDAGSRYEGPRVNPRESAKPQARDLSQILSGEEMAPLPGAKQLRSPSPSKADGTVFKAGAGKHHINNRLFDENESAPAPRSPERKKNFKEKYDHFAFGDGEDASDASRPTSGKGGSKNYSSQINFADFSTPPSVKEKARPDYECHWGAGVQEDDPPSPAKRPVVHAPRPDADKHFQLGDSPAISEPKPKSFQRQKGMGLYQDPLHEDERAQISKGGARRADDYSAHYSISDNTPEADKKIYKTAGDGMGGRKGGGRLWGFGEDSDPEEQAANESLRASARSRGSRQAKAGAGDF